MRVLAAAVACAPHSGSELSFGWEAVVSMSRDHELWVLTHGDCRAAIESAQAAGTVPPRLHFHYVSEPRTPHNRKSVV